MPHTTWGLIKASRSHTITSPGVVESLPPIGRSNACNLCHLDKTLAWTATHLHSRYGHVVPQLSADQKTIAASALWALEGDAAQRAFAAWSMGWDPARAVSADHWMAPLFRLFGKAEARTQRYSRRGLTPFGSGTFFGGRGFPKEHVLRLKMKNEPDPMNHYAIPSRVGRPHQIAGGNCGPGENRAGYATLPENARSLVGACLV